MFSISQTAKLFGVERKTILDWSYYFSEYLSKSSNPPKREQRFYTIEDIRIFAYVLLYWEEKPDIEYIKYGLNSGEFYDIEPINNLISHITPIFQEPTDENSNIETNMVFGGMAPLGDILSLANAFKKSGDMLVEATKDEYDRYSFISPILYQYRHAIELFLKSFLSESIISHDLLKLYEKFETLIQKEFQIYVPDWFKILVLAFDKIDKEGTVFRYGGKIEGDEILVDLHHIKTMMNWLAESISRIHDKLSEVAKNR